MARRLVESYLAVEIVASVEVYCKLISNVERQKRKEGNHIFTLAGTLRSCALMHTQIEATDHLLPFVFRLISIKTFEHNRNGCRFSGQNNMKYSFPFIMQIHKIVC